jgi:sulfur dioxygenase
LADVDTKEAIIIDAVDETQQRDIGLIEELGLDLRYIVETHVHADHITSSCLSSSIELTVLPP